MNRVEHTCSDCVHIDASIIDVYVKLLNMNQLASEAEAERAEAEEARVEAETERGSAFALDRERAEADHTGAESDRERAAEDHRLTTTLHQRANSDHTRANEDHTAAAADHSTAESDHERADADHERADEDHRRSEIDLSELGALAYKDSVNLSKGSGKQVLGADTQFTTQVTPTKTRIKATASGTRLNVIARDAIKSVNLETEILDTDTVPNVTSVGTPSTWGFAIGSGADAETLIISGANGSAPTLGMPKTVATGTVLGGAEEAHAVSGQGLTCVEQEFVAGVSVSAQPTIELSDNAAAGTGVVEVATGIQSAATTAGNNDNVNVAKYGDLNVSVS